MEAEAFAVGCSNVGSSIRFGARVFHKFSWTCFCPNTLFFFLYLFSSIRFIFICSYFYLYKLYLYIVFSLLPYPFFFRDNFWTCWKLLCYRDPLGLLYNPFISPSSSIRHLHLFTENSLTYIFHGGLEKFHVNKAYKETYLQRNSFLSHPLHPPKNVNQYEGKWWHVLVNLLLIFNNSNSNRPSI